MIMAGKEPEPAVPAESLTEPEIDPEADDSDKAAEDERRREADAGRQAKSRR